MRKITTITFAVVMLFSLLGMKAFSQKPKASDITGIWYNEEKTSKVQVYQIGNLFFAKIVWLKEPLDKNTGKPRVDNLNPDLKQRNNPLIGLVVLKNFAFDGDNEWNDGTIYDPKNGKTYSCYCKFDDSPNKLKIRGYIGVSLLGRTTYWTRTTL
jgi:uncharacterized protein (DUF2147 family)